MLPVRVYLAMAVHAALLLRSSINRLPRQCVLNANGIFCRSTVDIEFQGAGGGTAASVSRRLSLLLRELLLCLSATVCDTQKGPALLGSCTREVLPARQISGRSGVARLINDILSQTNACCIDLLLHNLLLAPPFAPRKRLSRHCVLTHGCLDNFRIAVSRCCTLWDTLGRQTPGI